MGDLVTFPQTETVWICAGLKRTWRVASAGRDFGEFDDIQKARDFLLLLCDGNDELKPLMLEEKA